MNSLNKATFTSMYVQALLDVAHKYKILPETILDHAGLSDSDISKPGAIVTQPQLMVMYQAVSLLSGKAAIGLEVGTSTTRFIQCFGLCPKKLFQSVRSDAAVSKIPTAYHGPRTGSYGS